MASIDKLNTVLERLEVAAQKLEKMSSGDSTIQRLEQAALRLEKLSGSQTATASVSNASVTAFDALISGPELTTYRGLSATIGGVVNEQAILVDKALEAQRDLIDLASRTKKPADFIGPLNGAINAIVAIKDKNRPSPLFSHLSAVADGIGALGWVVVSPAPVPYINEVKDAAQFYANRVIKDFKEKDKCHVDWVKSFLEFLTQLAAYVKTHHTTGLVWNEKGQEALSAAPPSVAAAPAAISGNLFGELQGNVTAGLRKVDKAQVKLEKANATPIQPKEPVARAVTTPAPAKSKPPVLELQGNKWVVENQMNQSNLIISGVEIRHVVYIYNCQNSTIKIDGKVNAITLDSCKKTGLLVSDVVASLETVNCKSVQIQVTGKLPLVQIDKTDGCQLYLSKESLECQVYSAKSSELNILVPNGDEFAEKPVCEQFKTTIVNGELVTECVVHKE